MNKFISFFLLTIFVVKIIVWLYCAEPIGRASMLVIILLLVILTIKTQFTWLLGISSFVGALTFQYWKLNIFYSDPFYFMDSVAVPFQFKTNDLLGNTIITLPFFLYIFLLINFLTRTYRVKYGISKAPNKWNFWNRIF